MTKDYVTDVPYQRSFVDLSPSQLSLVAALNGFPTPITDGDFDYCEMGSAQGDSIAPLAAANPNGRFVGVDVNHAHIEAARRFASEGKLENLRFVERDFEHLDEDATPPFDFMAAHGVLSWVGPSKRKALLDFAAAKLKPGGLLHVSYNALPGWAAVEPLRQLLLTGAAGANQDDTRERARLGFALAKHMHDAGALYFAGNSSAGVMLRTMEELGIPYIAHEYLNAHWVPMYFAQVAREMAERDLHFVGQLPLYMNYRDLALPPNMSKLLEGVHDRGAFETLKDFALNEFFRRDVFIKGSVGRAAATTQAYFDVTAFGLQRTPPITEVRLPQGTVTFEGPLFEALFDALTKGAATGTALLGRPELATFGAENIRAALLRAVVTGCVLPVQPAPRASARRAGNAPRIPLEYNRMVLRHALRNEMPLALAAPRMGAGMAISAHEALVLRLLTEVPSAKWQTPKQWTHDLLVKDSYSLKVAGRPVNDVEEATRILLAEVDKFRQNRLPRFLEWGILE
ncbi:class I SAM-dependent methyltransferase [Pendulispora brunnea]|uniref:Class I SAM-dependent methyltransferase n=1 Tax=Pendulispora brunnea TaxID=2905690 RepID=A0ABZ2JXN4_9BACT